MLGKSIEVGRLSRLLAALAFLGYVLSHIAMNPNGM